MRVKGREWQDMDLKSGRVVKKWEEVEGKTTKEYVELYCAEHKQTIRLYPKRMDLLLDGVWKQVADGYWETDPGQP